MRSILGVLATAFTLTTAPQADACGRDTPCAVDEGQYFIAMPPDADGPVPALVYIHGFGGNGAGALRNSGMLNGFLDRGYAVIAPDGMPRQNGGGRSCPARATKSRFWTPCATMPWRVTPWTRTAFCWAGFPSAGR